jgi:GT2 family glycosyltransferase
VTALVVTHDSARHLGELARALAASSRPPDEVLVLDNASRDDTVERARAVGFAVHETGANIGFGAACNVALRLLESEYALICNPDVRPAPDALAQLLDALDRAPHAAIAGAACDRPGHARRSSTLAGNVWGFLPGFLQSRLAGIAAEARVESEEPTAVDYVVGAFMLCRVAALREAGGFDERFFLYSEEEDLCLRLRELGWQTLLVPAVTVGHEDRGSSEGVGGAMASFYLNSLYLYYRKHRSRSYAELARLVLSACVLGDRAYRALTHRRQVYERGTAWAPFRDARRLRAELEARKTGLSA